MKKNKRKNLLKRKSVAKTEQGYLDEDLEEDDYYERETAGSAYADEIEYLDEEDECTGINGTEDGGTENGSADGSYGKQKSIEAEGVSRNIKEENAGDKDADNIEGKGEYIAGHGERKDAQTGDAAYAEAVQTESVYIEAGREEEFLDDDECGEDDYWEAAAVQEGAAVSGGKISESRGRTGRKSKTAPKRQRSRRRRTLEAMDIASVFLGILILAGAAALGAFSFKAKTEAEQVAAFAEIGTQMEGIEVVGESGLLAMMDAQNEKAAVAEAEALEEAAAVTEFEEKELYADGSIQVEMHLSSVQKDLKIKFVNKETGRLIPSVPFEVTVTGADKKSYVLKDEDMDGIIYQADAVPGKYSVAMLAVESAPEYAISTASVAVTVKDTIEYKKVDVADEIKKESEVNAAVEDTKRDTAAESTLQDTVDFVESTKKITEETTNAIKTGEYEEVPKENVAEPAGTAVGTGGAAPSGAAVAEGGANLNAEIILEDGATPNDAASEGGANPGETPISATLVLNYTEVTLNIGKTFQVVATVQGMEDKSITWISDNEAVAAVAMDGTITGVGQGTAAVTAVSNGNGSLTAACAVTVIPGPEADHVTKLSDKNGNQLFVINTEGNFREAVYADYYTADKFYRKVQAAQPDASAQPDTSAQPDASGQPDTSAQPDTSVQPDASAQPETLAEPKEEYKYTGWQTIDGKTYYFDANGNKVTGEQVIQGVKYNFDSEGVLSAAAGNMGIDVSRWNGSIDWNAVKNSGVSYVIIRCGYRGSTTGALIEDSMFRTNIQGAASAGLKVGIYFVTQAVNEVEAVEEASMVLSLINGYHISYPVFLDVEPSGGRADGIDKATRTAVCRAFCQTIANSGYTAGIYANNTWLNEKIDTPSLTNYKIWLAQYRAEPTYTATRYDLWQYSAKGTIPGISEETDLNISYLGY